MSNMKTLQIEKPNEVVIKSIEIPVPKESEVLIKVMASGICGTDIHILRGEYMGEYPVVPGHEFSGVVEGVGANVNRIKVGERVAVEPNIACDNCSYCLNNKQNFCENWQAVGVTLPGGMAQYVCAPEKAVFGIGELSFESGAFVEPLACVLHGIERIQLNLADNVLIVGAGPIGNLLMQVAKNQGIAAVTVVEPDEKRRKTADEFGASKVFKSLDDIEIDSYDVVIDATGVLLVMERTIEFVKKGGKILLFGVPPKEKVSIDAFTMFTKGVTVMSSFTSVRNSIQAITLLKEEKINVEGLISHKLSLEEFEKSVSIITEKKENVKKIIICPNT